MILAEFYFRSFLVIFSHFPPFRLWFLRSTRFCFLVNYQALWFPSPMLWFGFSLFVCLNVGLQFPKHKYLSVKGPYSSPHFRSSTFRYLKLPCLIFPSNFQSPSHLILLLWKNSILVLSITLIDPQQPSFLLNSFSIPLPKRRFFFSFIPHLHPFCSLLEILRCLFHPCLHLFHLIPPSIFFQLLLPKWVLFLLFLYFPRFQY